SPPPMRHTRSARGDAGSDDEPTTTSVVGAVERGESSANAQFIDRDAIDRHAVMSGDRGFSTRRTLAVSQRARPPRAIRGETAARWRAAVALSSAHVRVRVIGRRNERLLCRTRRQPTHQVEPRTGLVVRTRRTGTAERLLPDDRTGRLVVDVDVAGG